MKYFKDWFSLYIIILYMFDFTYLHIIMEQILTKWIVEQNINSLGFSFIVHSKSRQYPDQPQAWVCLYIIPSKDVLHLLAFVILFFVYDEGFWGFIRNPENLSSW